MADTAQTAAEVGRLINLIPVGLKEAAIDSPTSRATVAHYGEQVELLERWLEDYMKATIRLVAESTTLENILVNFTSHAIVPTTVSEAMLDHDYDVLAMKKYSEGAKDFWMSMVSVVKRLSGLVVEPIRTFLQNDLRAFKDARRLVETQQKSFDAIHTKYASLGKSKEPSSLREEAFQLHEARKAYLKANMDFFALAPQFRFSLDKLLVRIFYDQWKEMKFSRDNTAATFHRSAADMDRVKGWVSEMETSERAFRRDLQAARKQLEDAAEASVRPSRELEDYSSPSTSHYAGHGHAQSSGTLPKSPKKAPVKASEKQGWLYLRTYAGRPTRTVWTKRWAFLRNGVFGWLLQGSRAGGVEESERIGVLLCNVRPALNEERRFCFELKTNKHTIILQAETQVELMEWMGAFEVAKSKALEDPGATDTLGTVGLPHSDPAFAISPPPVPEFGSLILASTEPGAAAEDTSGALDRTSALPVPNTDHLRDSSVDLPRRSTAVEETGQRDHTSRIMSKLDLHRKATATPQFTPSPSTPTMGGGIASLIAASHGSMPVGPSLPLMHGDVDRHRNPFNLALRDMPASTLAPSTLANVPAPTSLSKSAVVVTGERGLSAALDKGGIPNGLMANMWGSSNTAFINRLDRSEPKVTPDARLGSQPSPLLLPSASPPKSPTPRPLEPSGQGAATQLDLALPPPPKRSRSASPTKRHVSEMSVDVDVNKGNRNDLVIPEFPNYYPLQLKTQDAQFRLLFPTVRRDERLVLVFRATWNPNDQQDFPGRIYVTANNIYFYSNHLGLVLTSTVSLSSIDEATAAPGRECDFLFLHLKGDGLDGAATRITVKTFLEPLKLLQHRINFLIRNSAADEPLRLEEVIKILLKMESEAPDRSPSLESWEEVPPDTPIDAGGLKRRGRSSTVTSELRAPLRVDRQLGTAAMTMTAAVKFKLPAQPVVYVPPGNLALAAEREFDVSPKALFHVMFGDKSALWHLLQHERRAKNSKQGPWLDLGEGRLRRDFEYGIPTSDMFGRARMATVRDYQVVDVSSDHLCYVVTDKRTPWYLPMKDSQRLVSKIVITHVAKGRCKLAVFVKVEWIKQPWAMKGMIERQAIHDLELDAQDLSDLVADQVRKLGAHSRTKKAVNIFGQVGQNTDVVQAQVDANAHHLELRRMPVSRSVTGLLMQGAASTGQSILGMVLDAVISFVTWLGKTFSANKMILAVLVVSALWNSWLVGKEGWVWYREREARKFLGRLGVGGDAVMTRAVYVKDVEELVKGSRDGSDIGSGACGEVFWNEYYDEGTGAALTGDHGSKEQQRKRRMQKTRQQLGNYRHDLLVAMRVVNSVERHVVRSEWEEWAREEARRCDRVGGLVERASQQGGSTTAKANETEATLEALAETGWFDQYCQSCKDEVGKLALM